MTETNPHEKLVTEGIVYPPEVIKRWGWDGEHWSQESWYRRELSLRHDMVCIYLCNTEKITDAIDVDKIKMLGTKKQRIQDPQEGSSSGTQTSSGSGGSVSKYEVGEYAAEELAEQEFQYRYALLEGMPAVNSIISTLCSFYAVPVPGKVFDIFDKKLRQWIEVKVTRNRAGEIERFHNGREPNINACLVHFDPSKCDVHYHGRTERLPGEKKAIDFLLARKRLLGSYMGTSEPDLFEEGDLIESIFRCVRFNADVDTWVDSWWKKRMDAKVALPKSIPSNLKFTEFSYAQMAGWIIDTTQRKDCPVMEFPGKVLPFIMTGFRPTSKETDEEMVEEFLHGLVAMQTDSFGELLAEVIGAWENRSKEGGNFSVSTRKECPQKWPALARALGIGRKETTRSDHDPDLVQEEFTPPACKQYSPWMSQLLAELSTDHTHDDRYFSELAEIEATSINPAAREAQLIRSQFYKIFGRSKISEYCSVIKNFYSRMGGAYFERYEAGNHGRVMYFPIYATSKSREDGSAIRRVSGICIRGPHHAKSATDRISFITVERVNRSPMGGEWMSIVKNAHLVSTMGGEHFVIRQNSICKQDPCFLSFAANATYLAGNFIGEMCLNSSEVLSARSLVRTADTLLLSKREWLMERVSESVMMAAVGKSQEEGAFAIIRKIYMATLAKWRGDTPLCRDWEGLAGSLNECLMESPLCLYWAKQTRDLLLKLGSQ